MFWGLGFRGLGFYWLAETVRSNGSLRHCSYRGPPILPLSLLLLLFVLQLLFPQARVNHPRPPNRVPPSTLDLTGAKPKEIKVETFRIDYLIRGPKVAKLSLQQIRNNRNPKPPNSNPKPEAQTPSPKSRHVSCPGLGTGYVHWVHQ